ncbi:MAG TPA: substrate-binding domain-containing protein [Bryobacteraceae bacterium]|nr:substrate-binding domain-containing protein [Bryobacteraceae bacterium]
MKTHTQLKEIREQRGVSAARLAKLAATSRQTIYAIEAGDYVPNTALALQLAKILEVKVEDLFRLEGETAEPAAPVSVDLIASGPAHKGQPVRLCRVGKRMVGVSAIPQPAMLPLADGVIVGSSKQTNHAEVHVFQEDPDNEKRLLIAGCDPGISLLVQHMARYEDVDTVVASSSSQQALEWLRQGKVHVAGSHLRDLPSGEYNLPVVRRLFGKREAKVVTFAIWEQGLVLQPGNPKSIHSAADLARKNVSIMNREKGAGSRDLLDQKLREAGVSSDRVRGYDRVAYGHLPAALAVSMHEADCCIATRSAARAFGLSFVPLATERYDLVLRRQHARLPAIQALLDTLNRAAIRRKLEVLAGYDTSHTGEVLLA